jgi:Uma2 family endonuclease
MGSESSSRLTYADLEHFPDDGLRREIIDGILHVTSSPNLRHQRVVGRIFIALDTVLRPVGGEAFMAPLDVVFDRFNVVEPDVLAVAAEKAKMLGIATCTSCPTSPWRCPRPARGASTG